MKIQYLIIFLIFSLNVGYTQDLDELFKIARDNNPKIQAEKLRYEASIERINQTGELNNPTLSAGYFLAPIVTRNGPQNAKIGISQSFPWFGTFDIQKRDIQLKSNIYLSKWELSEQELLLKVAEAYFPIIENEKLIAIEEENLEILNYYKDITTGQFANNKGPMVDVLKVDLLVNDSEFIIQNLQEKRNVLVRQLYSLLNVPTPQEFISSDSTGILDDRILTLPTDFDDNLGIKVIKSQVTADSYKTKVAQNMRKPSFGVGLDYVFIGRENPGEGSDAIMPMVSFSLPIFNKKSRSMEAESQLLVAANQHEIEDLRNRIKSEYDNIVFDMTESKRKTELYDKQLEELNNSLKLLFANYENSGDDFEDILKMQSQILDYKKREVKTAISYHKNIYRLKFITGKLITE